MPLLDPTAIAENPAKLAHAAFTVKADPALMGLTRPLALRG